MNCTICGSVIEPSVSFCTNCGAPVAASVLESTTVAPDEVAIPEPYRAEASSQAYPEPPIAAVGATGQAGAYQEPSYQSNAYQEPSYQQPAYQQPAYQQSAYQQQTPSEKALAMCLYTGLLALIFGFVQRDMSNQFITHHLNQALVILIGSIIAAITTIFFIGMLLGLYLFVMMIMGMVSAYNGNMNELPLIGKIKIIH